MQGWRLSMEDAHICNTKLDADGSALFAVFDGHGGIEVAKFCEANFERILLNNANYKNKNYGKALQETFVALDEILLTMAG